MTQYFNILKYGLLIKILNHYRQKTKQVSLQLLIKVENIKNARYSAQLRDKIFLKGYGFLSFAKNMNKIIGQNISQSLNNKYSQKLLHAKNSY